MRNAIAIALFGTFFLGVLTALPAATLADHVGQAKNVNGMTVYLGLMPVDVMRQKPDQYPRHQQSKFPSGRNVYHLLLAVFDTSSGERITDALVEASVAPLAFAGAKKTLDPMDLAGSLTYCNYFRISPLDRYVIKADIRRPNAARATRVEFHLNRDAH